ncbi:MAG TPA: J domain-containing protein [Xanthobacteraceae bacterium]|jgi:hypothetical protein|nr:J domain-containing protein [Xanthobacteraceae bacterium]
MKFDSTIFDSIRVKPAKGRKSAVVLPTCEWAGCSEGATHRAPKGRGHENQYLRFCLQHVREYNHSYNYFAGMSDDAVTRYQKDAITGHRPTWKMGVGKTKPRPDLEGATDPLNMFHEFANGRQQTRTERPQPEQRAVRNAERKALDALGLEVGAERDAIKMRFKMLVKRHHPDVNGGDRSTEDRLVEIIQAYKYLKTAGFC